MSRPPERVVLPVDDAQPGELSHNKVCNLGDFAHPDLVPYLHAAMPEMAQIHGDAWPARSPVVERKMWEVAMALRTFDEFGVLNGETEVLGVGAGQERT